MDDCRPREEAAVGVRHSGVEPVLRPRAILGEVPEQLAEVVRARPRRLLDELVEDVCEDVPRKHPQVLREHAPDALKDQVGANVRLRPGPLLEPLDDLGDE
jgi:hypothetical protein